MSAKVWKRENAVLLDAVIEEINEQMAVNLQWMTNIFGKVERLIERINGRNYYSANIHTKGNDYMRIAPDSGLGNFSFFIADEPEYIDYNRYDQTHFKYPVSLVVWVDMRTMPSGAERNIEGVKQEITRFLNGGLFLRSGRFFVTKIYNKAESIFEGFTLEEIDNQFLMQPYCGWRFEGEIELLDTCAVQPVPPVEPQYIRGHFTDGRTTFTFNINSNQPIIVDVDKNGWWKWDVDRTITSLRNCCLGESITILDYIEMVGVNLNNIFDYYFAFGQNAVETDGQRIIDMSQCKGAITTTTNYFAARAKCLWYMPNIENWGNGLTLQGQSRIIAKGYIKTNIGIGNLNNLLKNNVLSIIQAAQANVTYTLHSTIYAKCASGGEWHTDIQAAIDAKAAQGYIVTLISA